MAHALRLFGIHKRYRVGHGGCHATVDALRGITLHVRAGEVVVIAGRPGSGKSTLLMCAAGLLRPDRGRVRWFGESASPVGRPPGVIYRLAPAPYGSMTVSESLAHSALRRAVFPSATTLRHALDRVALGTMAAQRVSRLGAGELRRLALAEMVLSAPRIALLDDIADESDTTSGSVIVNVIAWLASRGVTVLATTAQARTLAAVASRVLALDEGRLKPPAAPLPRALELTVDHASRVASRLGRHRPVRTAGTRTVRIALGGASAEEVLAECRRLGIAVHGSRIVLVGSLSRAQVAEEPAPVR
jgi:ABC-type multidrug transport system ATPase subunit